MMAEAAYCAGDPERGVRLWTELHATACNRGDRLQQAWGLNGRSEGLLRTGGKEQAGEAAALLGAALRLFAENTDRISVLTTHGLLAVAQFRAGNRQAARQAAEDGMRLVEMLSRPTSYYMLGGYWGVASTLLDLWETESPERGKVIAGRAMQACRALARYARAFPLGGPSACLCNGRVAWLAGRRRAAMRAWRKCLAIAARLGMPWEQGLAHLEIGRHLPAGSPERQEHLARAGEIFARTHSRFDLARTQDLLRGRAES